MRSTTRRQPLHIIRATFRPLLCTAVWIGFANIGHSGIVFFNNATLFGQAMSLSGHPLVGVEDFEGSTLTAPSNQNINDPLTQGVSNGAYPTGLSQPMTVQTNTLNASATTPSPGSIMLLVPAGSRNSVSDVAVPASSAVSFDWIMHIPRIMGVGLNPIILHDGGLAELKVYNQHNQLLGTFQTPADAAASHFVGIQVTGIDRISRINFRGLSGFGRAAGDNAHLYIPEPSSAVMLCISALAFVVSVRTLQRK
jgi:hypothetical protein